MHLTSGFLHCFWLNHDKPVLHFKSKSSPKVKKIVLKAVNSAFTILFHNILQKSIKMQDTALCSRPVGRSLKLVWPIKCLFPPKNWMAHYCTFWLRSAKSWGGPGHPGHPSTYGPARCKSLLESWNTTFLPDCQPPSILV